MALVNQPTFVEKGKLGILIMDAPNDANAPVYLKILETHNVSAIARTCESTYDKAAFENKGIKVHEINFPDGESPEDKVIEEWLEVVDGCLNRKTAVAVQCLAGLGRAPVMAAVALIERAGMDPMETITFIRGKRKGAINARQVKFLEHYKPKTTKKGDAPCCAVM